MKLHGLHKALVEPAIVFGHDCQSKNNSVRGKVERIGKAMETFDRARRRGKFAEMQESVQRAIERKAAGDGEILFARLRTRIDALHEERRDGPARSGRTDSLHIKRFRARRWACDLCALRPKEVLPE